MRLWRRARRCEPMPADFEKLAIYNREVARGVQHTAERKAAMAHLQERFDEWAKIRP